MKLEWRTCFRIGVSVFVLYLCICYWQSAAGLMTAFLEAAAPLLVGCVVAYLINILMDFYERHYLPGSGRKMAVRSRRPVCMAAAFITLLAIAALVICLVVPQLSSCVQIILAALPGAMQELALLLEQSAFLPDNIAEALNTIDWQSASVSLLKLFTSGLGSVMDVVVNTISVVFSGIVTAFLAVIFSVYLLADKEKLKRQCNRVMTRYIKQTWYDRIRHVLSVINECFHQYIVGQCTEAVILGLLCMLGMLILRLPYATMIGALIAFTALIPIAGAYIGAGVGAFMIMTVSPVKAVIFLIFIVVLQQVEGNLIYPRVVGSSIGLPAIWVLAAVTVGGGIMGIPGMLLGVPLAAAAYRLLREDVNKPARAGAECAAAKKQSKEC